jgi:Tfp pilus assembly protein PilF
MAAACAGHQPPDTGNPFVTRSRTTYTDGATFDAPKASAGAAAPQSHAAPSPDPDLPKAPVPKTADVPTLESTNASLAAAVAELKAHPTAENYIVVGMEYERLGVLDAADTALEKALKLDHHSSAANEGLARVWRDWGLPQQGLGYAYRAVSAAPQSASAHNTLGTLLFTLGDPEAARTHFDKALALDTSAAYALNNLCYVAFMLGDAGPAVTRCTEALALNPASTTTRNNLGLIYAAQGRNDDAAREFEKAGGGPTADYNMGIVHMVRHEYKDAIALFEAGCRAKPEIQGACAWAKEARKLAAKEKTLGPQTSEYQRASRVSGAGNSGAPASERVGGSAGAKPPGD